jgi:hypothetical protein
MHSPGRAPAVQGRRAQAAAVADALASLGRTRAGMASLTAYGKAAAGAGQRDHPRKLWGSAALEGLEGRERAVARRVPRDRGTFGPRGGRLPVARETRYLQESKCPKLRRAWEALGLQKNFGGI